MNLLGLRTMHHMKPIASLILVVGVVLSIGHFVPLVSVFELEIFKSEFKVHYWTRETSTLIKETLVS